MGFFDRLFGRGDDPAPQPPARPANQPAGQLSDEQAIARYRYMLQTAPPETIEQAHAEAFAQLTPEQRRIVLQQLSAVVPEQERRAAGDDPQTLARLATRAEMRQPGTLERTFGGMGGGGIGMGGLMAGSFLSSFAGVMLGSLIAQQFFHTAGFADSGYGQEGALGDPGADQGVTDQPADDSSFDTGGSFGGSDFGDAGGDFGGDFYPARPPRTFIATQSGGGPMWPAALLFIQFPLITPSAGAAHRSVCTHRCAPSDDTSIVPFRSVR